MRKIAVAFALCGTLLLSLPACSTLSSQPQESSASSAPGSYTLMYGTILEASESGGTLTIRANVPYNSSDEFTIKQHYYNVEDIIKNQGGDQFSEIDYQALSKMSSMGEAEETVSFSVDSVEISAVASGQVTADGMGDRASELYIHPDLQAEEKASEATPNTEPAAGGEPQENDAQTQSSQTEKSDAPKPQNSSSSGASGHGNANNFNLYDNPEQQKTEDKWVLNTSTMKIHYPTCREVKKIAEKNYSTSNKEESELIAEGYTTCGVCH